MAFTLTELLVAMGIIAVLSTMTLVSVKAMTRDARLSAGRNAVAAALGNARALAMKRNAIVLVAFRPQVEGEGRTQVVQAVTAQWTGETVISLSGALVDRFEPIHEIAFRPLPRGIKVAGPMYRSTGTATATTDREWVTQSHFPRISSTPVGGVPTGEPTGEMIGIIYAPDGTTITRNSQSDASAIWLDFDGDRVQQRSGLAAPPPGVDSGYFDHRFPIDESMINVVPFLAVYDDQEARETRGDEDWSTTDTLPYFDDLLDGDSTDGDLGFISQYAQRIHFNRYTGVIMK